MAVARLIKGGDPSEPEIWVMKVEWKYGSCIVSLVPSHKYDARVFLPRDDIAHSARVVFLVCVKEEHMMRGGWIPIGSGLFSVAVTGTPSNAR